MSSYVIQIMPPTLFGTSFSSHNSCQHGQATASDKSISSAPTPYSCACFPLYRLGRQDTQLQLVSSIHVKCSLSYGLRAFALVVVLSESTNIDPGRKNLVESLIDTRHWLFHSLLHGLTTVSLNYFESSWISVAAHCRSPGLTEWKCN